MQGGTFSILAPTLAIMSSDDNKCPDDFDQNGWNSYNLTYVSMFLFDYNIVKLIMYNPI